MAGIVSQSEMKMACRVRPGFPLSNGLADSHRLRVGKYPSRLAIKKKSGSPGPGMSMEASRIALLHARLQFFSAALFLDGPRCFPGVVR